MNTPGTEVMKKAIPTLKRIVNKHCELLNVVCISWFKDERESIFACVQFEIVRIESKYTSVSFFISLKEEWKSFYIKKKWIMITWKFFNCSSAWESFSNTWVLWIRDEEWSFKFFDCKLSNSSSLLIDSSLF